jgi:short-subunit dehydrogenase
MSKRPTALITGASSGIGAEFARQLAAQNYDLILVARRSERLLALANEIINHHPVSTTVLPADLSDDESLCNVEQAIRECPQLDLLINNAGFGVRGNFASGAIDKHLSMIDVHVIATVRLSRAALPSMVAARRGGIINVSSVAAFFPAVSNPTYSATKAYLNAFSESLAAELRGTGVKVQALCPGFTITEFHSTTEYKGLTVHSQVPRLAWLTDKRVVSDSLKDLQRNRTVCIPGMLYQIAVLLGRTGLAGFFLTTIRARIRKSLSNELQ